MRDVLIGRRRQLDFDVRTRAIEGVYAGQPDRLGARMIAGTIAERVRLQVRQAIDLARERVAALLGCEPGEIVFTSCGTESNNAAVNSALQLSPTRQHIVTTAVEHSATRRHCEVAATRGCSVTVLGVDEKGNLDLEELERSLRHAVAILGVRPPRV